MIVTTSREWTVSELLAELEQLEPDTPIKFSRSTKPKPGKCWCNCGSDAKSRFLPGHDAAFHGLAKKSGRGEVPMPTEFASDEAKADFMKWYEIGRSQVPQESVKVVDIAEVDDDFLDELS